MKKRVRILISLLIISGSLTVTSKSYAESRVEMAILTSYTCILGGVIGSSIGVGSYYVLNKAKKLLAANRAAKIGRVVLAQKDRDIDGLFLGGSIAIGAACAFTLSFIASASEIVENPALAIENNESFRLLAKSVGTELAFSSVERIANGEDPETVVNSLASLLEKNSNNEDGDFLDSGNEEDMLKAF